MSDYVAVVRKLENNIFFESKTEDEEHQLDIAEGYAYKRIKYGWQQYLQQYLEQC